MLDKDKAEFARYLKNRRNKLQAAAARDLTLMNNAVARLPDNVGKLTRKQVVLILQDCIMETELEFGEGSKHGKEIGDADEKWLQRFFS